jgi:hypothetical protein
MAAVIKDLRDEVLREAAALGDVDKVGGCGWDG